MIIIILIIIIVTLIIKIIKKSIAKAKTYHFWISNHFKRFFLIYFFLLAFVFLGASLWLYWFGVTTAILCVWNFCEVQILHAVLALREFSLQPEITADIKSSE